MNAKLTRHANGFTEVSFPYGIQTVSAMFGTNGKLSSARFVESDREIGPDCGAWRMAKKIEGNL